MDSLKTALDALNVSLQKLEEAVVVAKNKRTEDTAKIAALHEAVTTAYSRIDKAISRIKQGDD